MKTKKELLEYMENKKLIEKWKTMKFLTNSSKMTFKDQVERCNKLEKCYGPKFQKELMEFDKMSSEEQKKDILIRIKKLADYSK